MFWILVLVGVVGVVLSILGIISARKLVGIVLSYVGLVLSISIFIAGWESPQGQVCWEQLIAPTVPGNWLVVDNSGGETMRHWVLEDSYVGPSDQSDGWKLNTGDGVSYVGSDAFVHRIKKPLENFLEDYRVKYNIPEESVAIH